MSFQNEADYPAAYERQPSRRLPFARRFSIGSALRRLRLLLLAPIVALLSACNLVVLNPAGDVAAQQGDLLMISTLLMSAPSQCETLMTSFTATPGKRYLLPPEKPTTSCGTTGPTMRFTSDSTHSLLICTRIGMSVSRPPVSSAMRSAEISPRSAICSGSSHAWLTTVHSG